MRSFLLNIHIYTGLLCSSYLLIFGISSLNFNHHFGKPRDERVVWERALVVINQQDNEALGATVRDQLGLFGWPLPHDMKRDDKGNFHFGMGRPGKQYSIHVFFYQNRVKVEETRKGFWSIVDSLHALMRVPSSPFMFYWGVYTELCTWAVLSSAASGVYLWARRRKERFIGWVILGAASGTSLLFMLYVWWRG